MLKAYEKEAVETGLVGSTATGCRDQNPPYHVDSTCHGGSVRMHSDAFGHGFPHLLFLTRESVPCSMMLFVFFMSSWHRVKVRPANSSEGLHVPSIWRLNQQHSRKCWTCNKEPRLAIFPLAEQNTVSWQKQHSSELGLHHD